MQGEQRMSNGPKPLIAGNWKMNGLRANLSEISLMGAHFGPDLRLKADLMICPPFPLLGAAVDQSVGQVSESAHRIAM